MNKLERKMLFLGILLLGLFSILFCVHSVAMILLPVGISEDLLVVIQYFFSTNVQIFCG